MTQRNDETLHWLHRAAELADQLEAELELCRLLARNISAWPQALCLDQEGNPFTEPAFRQLVPELERSSSILRAACSSSEILAALREIPLPVLRGLRACAENKAVLPRLVMR